MESQFNLSPEERQILLDNIQQIKKDTEAGPESIVEGLGIGFGICDWGSCQYCNAWNMFNALELLTEKYGESEALNILGIRWKHSGLRDLKEVKEAFITENFEAKYEMDDDDKEKLRILEELEFTRDNVVPELFDVCRNMSWDLWSAAPYLASLIFKEFEVEEDSIKPAPGEGPILNVLAQSENYMTGFCCWALWRYSVNREKYSHEGIFGGFDT